ncbi:hypothetical protein K438DRAFT_1784596 [Mycena galopus ATCC 62051]|nr:hypothetical protein K438DRAFT_1784596 [Mycena galopus ATCC 62051]
MEHHTATRQDRSLSHFWMLRVLSQASKSNPRPPAALFTTIHACWDTVCLCSGRSASLDTPRAFPRNNGRTTSLNTFATNANAYTYNNTSSLNTPTQAHRFHATSRPPAPQFAIPEERTQMDHLVDMMRTLLNDMAELKQRVAFIETTLAHPRAVTPPWGMPSQRARGGARATRVTRSTRANSSNPAPAVVQGGSDESDFAPPSTTDVSTDAENDTESFDDEDVGDLSKTEKRALQSYVTKGFRRACNVPGRNWPDPELVRTNRITQEIYPTPIFSAQVTDLRNKAIFHAVAQQVLLELKDRDAWPKALRRPRGLNDPTWDLDILTEMAKDSFRSFKKQWNEVQRVEVAIRADTNRLNDRRLKRRQRVSGEIGPPRKSSQYLRHQTWSRSCFPCRSVHEQFLSDEASGPEDTSVETKEAWKVRLAAAANLPLVPDAQKELKLLEIVVPSWRSDMYSNLIHDLEDFSLNGITPTQELNLKYNRVVVEGE